MRVFVLNHFGKPLMPTRPRNARVLLRENLARVVKRTPFTIQLTHSSGGNLQPITLGVDAGSKYIGVSASTRKQELYSGQVDLRTDIVKKLASKRQYRRSRRNRKTRYRKPRFLNRVKTKHKGWLAPSIEAKINTHLQMIQNLHKLLPITKVVIETASFDTQLLQNPEISGRGYQQGPQVNSWNVREYVLFRDNHRCVACHGKSKDPILNVHHLESRKTGGNRSENLVTLCQTYHKNYHAGKLELTIQRGASFRDAAFMGIMRWTTYNRLKERFSSVYMTFGYITKYHRIAHNLPKNHRIDTYCVAGNFDVEPAKEYYYQKKVRCHNRQLHKANTLKGGLRKKNQAPEIVYGYQLFDKVLAENTEWFIFGRRTSGYFDLRKLDGTNLNKGSYSYKKIKQLESRTGFLTERRNGKAELFLV
ncbi:MAG: RNA-guided endonuclease IscB [Enterococcus sp.]